MQIYNLHTMKREESVSSPFSVALGNFDGVHAGHAELISRCVSHAQSHGHASAVWTFSDGTGTLPNKPGVRCLTATDEKLALIAALGVDYVILEEFSDVRELSPESFVKDLLINKYGAVCAVCGYNFRFGAGGAGDCEALQELMKPLDCIVVPPFYADGEPVSSTAVRKLLEDGDTERAACLLGRPFHIAFPVVDGKHLGRTIGIPTVNQNFPDGHVIPRYGIYACTVEANGQTFPGVANIGVRPTVKEDSHKVNCETHIIGFDGWLYGQRVKVSFYRRLRDEMRFVGIDELKAQIKRDIAAALGYFSDIKMNFKSSEGK